MAYGQKIYDNAIATHKQLLHNHLFIYLDYLFNKNFLNIEKLYRVLYLTSLHCQQPSTLPSRPMALPVGGGVL